jgi:GMP synthase-like glutamine amidotransferase
MRLHYLQHVPFEDPANILVWAKGRGLSISGTRLFSGESLPRMDEFDWLVIMGGPMNIYEEDLYPWLAYEKEFIAGAIRERKVVWGICLGAQLIADLLGGKVYGNHHKEIGWHPVQLSLEARDSLLFGRLPDNFVAFHWHGDTFHKPIGATVLASSEACAIQAFEYDEGRVLGLQFHVESSLESIGNLIDNCGNELIEAQYVQRSEAILAEQGHVESIERIMTSLLNAALDRFAGKGNNRAENPRG